MGRGGSGLEGGHFPGPGKAESVAEAVAWEIDKYAFSDQFCVTDGGIKTLLVESAPPAAAVLEMKAYGGPSNGVAKFSPQLLAAKLNIKVGASASSVSATLRSADAFPGDLSWEDWNLSLASGRRRICRGGWLPWMTATTVSLARVTAGKLPRPRAVRLPCRPGHQFRSSR